MKKDIYRIKQEWIERVFASELTPAQKVFAFGIFKRMYGDKIESYPDTEYLVADTGLSRSKFSEHRQALFDAGALTGVKDRKARGRQENYTYRLNVDWDGEVPPREDKSPAGTTNVPPGNGEVPSGSSNTSKNTTKSNTTSKTTIISPVPSGPVEIETSSNLSLEEVSLAPEDSLNSGQVSAPPPFLGIQQVPKYLGGT